MDIINLCMDSPAMVNEDPKAKKPYSARGQIMILIVYVQAS